MSIDTVVDTLIRGCEIFVEGPVQDVGYIRTEGVTCAGVHRVLGDLPISHAGALEQQRSHIINTIYTVE